jgi:hypothetical protein
MVVGEPGQPGLISQDDPQRGDWVGPDRRFEGILWIPMMVMGDSDFIVMAYSGT